MPVDKIDAWDDSRVEKRSAHLNGRTYGYLYGRPKTTTARGTLFLIHGFPDLSMGWRYQIPLFLSLGLRVVAPDCMGYGRTDAPPFTLKDYGYKRVSDDIAELARQLGCERIILGGHDWGGAIVYRTAQYYPALVTHAFSVCTSYFPPSPIYIPLQSLASYHLRNLTYHLHMASGELESSVQSPAEIRQFLSGMYGARGPNRETIFDPNQGILLTNLPLMGKSPLLTDRELDYYVSEYSRHGIHGPLNWYRTREVNYVDELEHFFDGGKRKDAPGLEQEVLLVMATKDTALRPDMASKMGETVPKLTRREVRAGHWALWEKPSECNEILREWFNDVVFRAKGASSKL